MFNHTYSDYICIYSSLFIIVNTYSTSLETTCNLPECNPIMLRKISNWNAGCINILNVCPFMKPVTIVISFYITSTINGYIMLYPNVSHMFLAKTAQLLLLVKHRFRVAALGSGGRYVSGACRSHISVTC